MKFVVTYAVLVLLLGTRLLSHLSSPGVGSVATVTVLSCVYAAVPVTVWYAMDRRRRPR